MLFGGEERCVSDDEIRRIYEGECRGKIDAYNQKIAHITRKYIRNVKGSGKRATTDVRAPSSDRCQSKTNVTRR